MAGINKVILVGNLGKDPVISTLESGVKKAAFSLATTESYTRDGQKFDNTEWHNIVFWRHLAEIAEKWLKKGSQVYIEGKIKTRKWTDQNGNDKYTTEIIGENMVMLGGKKETSPSEGNYSPSPSNDIPPVELDQSNDLPF